jgi:CheY-specific phosphatase CheX
MENENNRSTENVLKVLCDSVNKVLSLATQTTISYSPMVQKVNKTCLKPDIGCFVLFDGGFSGLVVMNFSKEAAMEIYRGYMISMGMPEEELATLYTSDEVGNTLGELMNQIIGNFQVEVKKEFQCSVNQNQPKMIVLNKELMVSINAPIQNPQYRKVAFETANHRPFYLEICMEHFEFIELYPFEKQPSFDADALIAEVKGQG